MKKTLMVVGIGLALVFLMGTILPDMAAAQQAQPQFKWRMATLYPRASYGLTYPTFADACKKMSGGRLEVTIVYDGEGIPATEVLNAVRTGLAEMGQPYQALHAGEFPAGVVELGLPGGPSNIVEIRALFHEGGWDKIMKKAYATQNAMWVWEMPQPATYLLTKKPINKLDDIKKWKIRCPGAYGRMLAHLGASPVTMAFAEVYSSLASGLVDGVDGCNIPDHEGGKFYEQAKYLYPLPLSGAQLSSVIVNLNAWNKLPDDLKEIVVGATSLLGDDQQNKTGLWEKESLAKMVAKGVKWSPKPSAADEKKWAEAGQKVWDEYASKDQYCKELIEAQKTFMKRIGYQVK
jgi:TRAP-type mannitol/chloroaromatic compound transport system substrate-binding protein